MKTIYKNLTITCRKHSRFPLYYALIQNKNGGVVGRAEGDFGFENKEDALECAIYGIDKGHHS